MREFGSCFSTDLKHPYCSIRHVVKNFTTTCLKYSLEIEIIKSLYTYVR